MMERSRINLTDYTTNQLKNEIPTQLYWGSIVLLLVLCLISIFLVNEELKLDNALILLTGFVALLVLHELIHVIVISLCGGKCQFAMNFNPSITTNWIFERNEFIVSIISPFFVLVLILLVLILLSLSPFLPRVVWIILFFSNAGLALQDVYMALVALIRLPKGTLIEENDSVITIYSPKTR